MTAETAPSLPILIVGSGASGVHFALTALELGCKVTMLDVGHAAPAAANPNDTVDGLKSGLGDPVEYFLGERYEAMMLPGSREEYYGFPPSKSYVFRQAKPKGLRAAGFAPLYSYARGGLAQAWTAGCYPFAGDEFALFPFAEQDIAPSYSEVARRIGVSGRADDLARFFPDHAGLQAPLKLDDASADLLSAYERQRETINRRLDFHMGYARLATLSEPHAGREPCGYLGRCLWGCPREAIYTPSITLRACQTYPGFQYVRGHYAKHFIYDDSNNVTGLLAEDLETGNTIRFPTGMLVLAGGTLETSRIVLESLHLTGERRELCGLMDNRQVLMPFLNLRRFGKDAQTETYQYNQLAVAAPGASPDAYVHGLVTTLNSALIHPVIQSVPLNARTSLKLFRDVHAALGMVNINFADFRRDENRIALDIDAKGDICGIKIQYYPRSDEAQIIKPVIKRFRQFLRILGCYAPSFMTRWRPVGASVHYTGTLPMIESGDDLTTDRTGRCRPFENLIIADGANFPALPAKNLTFTLMANATRIARELFAPAH